MKDFDQLDTRQKITLIVKEYNRLSAFKEERREFDEFMKLKRKNQINEFSMIKGDHTLERVLYDVPETLYNLFRIKLEDGDWDFFDSKEGARWFAKSFPQFRVPSKL